ncbi:AMP-binding protein [Streptomyces hundungensis]|uniref:AMP-binding protein n=1 Tax=Streptomyces hundungensis TaxID=1077946 RepID=UPI0033DA2D0D
MALIGNRVPLPAERLAHRVFEEHARTHPERLALTCGEERLTYGELNARANRLAHHLTAQGITRGAIVGVCVDRAVAALRAKGAAKVAVADSSIRAELPAGATGTAVFAMPRIAGWSCRVDGAAAAPAGDYLGLTAVALPSGARTVECSFRPPGLRSGSLVGGAALLALLSVAGWGRYRRTSRAGGYAPRTSRWWARARRSSAG